MGVDMGVPVGVGVGVGGGVGGGRVLVLVLQTALLDGFSMAIGGSSASAWAVEGTWDIESGASSTWRASFITLEQYVGNGSFILEEHNCKMGTYLDLSNAT